MRNVKALAHITGGGFIENIPRVLPDDLGATIRLGSWPMPPLFSLIEQRGGVDPEEMYRVFNMGIGMIVVADKSNADAIRAGIPEDTFVIGELVAGPKRVILS
ncbi:MAG: AIR synthase-related protein [Micropepsaceae bacterium]